MTSILTRVNRWKENEDIRTIAILAGIFFAITLAIGLNRHLSFFSSYDQGIFNQIFWNNSQGNWFQSSLSSQLSANVVHSGEIPNLSYQHLGQHFTPALLIWSPIYYFFPTATTLTVIMTLIVTASGVVLYFLAREYVNRKIAGMITLSFYCAITILGPLLSNYHNLSQVPLYTFSLLLALEKRCWWLFALFSLIILNIRQDSAIPLFGIGVYLIISRRYPKLGIGLCCFSFLYFVVLTNAVMPLFSDDVSKRYMLEKFGQYADGDEATTLDIMWGMLKNPFRLIVEIFSPVDKTIGYLLGHWLPFAFVPALSPTSWFISSFPLLQLLMGQGKSVLALNIRYAMMVVPGICYGLILWWAGQSWRNFTQDVHQLQPRVLTKKFQRFWLGCLGVSLLLTCIYSTTELSRAFYFIMPDSFQPWVHVSLTRQWQHAGNIYQLLAQIPDDASVTATNNIIPHLSSRRALVRLPRIKYQDDNQQAQDVDYIIADIWELERYGVVFTKEKDWLTQINSLVDTVTSNGQYEEIDRQDGVVLLRHTKS